jgi:hypothetical protein
MSQRTSRELVAQWARANAPVVEANLLTGFDGAAAKRLNCTFAISRELTKAEAPYFISCYGGELFVFTLNQRQAKSFNAIKHTMQCVEGGPSLELPPDVPPMMELGDMSFHDADGLGGEQPICGSLCYAKSDNFDYPGTICLAIEFTITGCCRVTEFYYPPQGLLLEGLLDFTFPAVNGQAGSRVKNFSGPVVAHVRFLGTLNPQAGGYVPLSNPAAALIELI